MSDYKYKFVDDFWWDPIKWKPPKDAIKPEIPQDTVQSLWMGNVVNTAKWVKMLNPRGRDKKRKDVVDTTAKWPKIFTLWSRIKNSYIKIMQRIMTNTMCEYFPKWVDFHTKHFELIESQMDHWFQISMEREKKIAGERKLCVVFDIDEILLSPIGRDLYLKEAKDMCQVYPGAAKLIDKCKEKHQMYIFFVTARTNDMRNYTLENLAYHGLFCDTLFTRRDQKIASSTFKEDCRKFISNKFRIALNIGDQVTDLGNYADVNYLIPNPFYVVS